MKAWYRWHRRTGLMAAPILLMLGVSGILINHLDQVHWQERPVRSPLLAWLYGIPLQTVEQGFTIEQGWLYQLGEDLYWNKDKIGQCSTPLLGALLQNNSLSVLCQDQLQWFTLEGQLIEQITSLPTPFTAVGVDNGTLVMKGLQLEDQKQTFWAFDEDNAEWRSVPPLSASQWQKLKQQAAPLPHDLKTHINNQAHIPGLNWERVLLDLHSGRLFGPLGVWLVDASGIVLILLIVSGMGTWLKRSVSRRRN